MKNKKTFYNPKIVLVGILVSLLFASNSYSGSSKPTKFAIPHITQEQFDDFAKTNKTVFIGFHTDWCGSCRAQHKSLASLQQDYKNVFMLNWDERKQFNIPAPAARTTIVAYREGKIIDQLIGSNGLDAIKNFLSKNSQ